MSSYSTNRRSNLDGQRREQRPGRLARLRPERCRHDHLQRRDQLGGRHRQRVHEPTYDLFDFASQTGTVAFNFTGLGSDQTATFNPANGVVSVTSTPEPATLTGLTLAGMVAMRRRRGA